ncbi:hypothetical protein KC343_g987 [Hortaea werneckii]|nr:hypothetical protein KC352_g7195 [Hortaea werneckii]KAI7626514.1 hypothetical protein KC346_g1240 [Hortaea werneckii]KAI7636908.1 hypothetical protein KC343_g987 [Hortaea werneckii]KAI7680946.1 hypothetical protein KC319_g1855 [Hortaea werneckii]KAI7723180.1 hypothetical protein KC322_g1236 [Hortaea werneckii]
MFSKYMESKTIRSKIVRFGRKAVRSVLPSVAPPDFSSRACVVLVVGKDINDKHCLATCPGGEKCENDVTAKAVLQSFKKLYSITSDDDELQEDLKEIAVKCICKHKRTGHFLQAPKIAENWIAKANAMAMWNEENFFKQE